MKNVIRKLRLLFGNYEIGCEYWVKIDDIQIIPQFKERQPKFKKMADKWNYYKVNGSFESPIKLMRNFTLVDGYTTYLLAIRAGLKEVPVYFVD